MTQIKGAQRPAPISPHPGFVRFIRSPVAEQGLAGLGDDRVPVPLRGAVIALSVSLVAMEAPHQRAPQRTGSHHRERETEEHNHHDEKAKIRRGPRTRGGTHREIHNFSFARRTSNSLGTVALARPCRHAVGDRWFVDETYVKVAGRWRYVYRAIDQHGQIIDVYVSARRDTQAARRFFVTALHDHGKPTEVITDRAWTLLAAVDELIPAAFHNTEQYANNRIEADHGRLKARLRPMRGLKRDHTARVIMRGHALMQNIRRGHYELEAETCEHNRIAHAFAELARTI